MLNLYKETPLQILIIEDNKDHAFLTSKTFQKAFPLSKITIAETAREAYEKLAAQLDIIVSDYNLPDEDGLAILKNVKSRGLDIPFVIMTGAGDEKLAVEALQAGAYNYLVKDEAYLSALPKVVREALDKYRFQKEKEALEQEIREKNTALERANQELRKLDQLKSEFIASVSHEFRTPLNSIKESIALLAEGVVRLGEEQGNRVFEIAANNVNRLALLIDDLLDFSKLEAGRMRLEKQPHDLSEIIEEVVDSMKGIAEKSKQIRLVWVGGGDHPQVFADKSRIVQVLMNLVDNAIKFTPPGGRVTITSEVNEEARAVVAVEDTGIGIGKEDLGRIFKKFEQVRTRQPGTEVRGTGLGLAISKQIVELHEGRIWVESELTRGSRFIFTLPVYGQAADPKAELWKHTHGPEPHVSGP
jgi:signal transduction histidine kinase